MRKLGRKTISRTAHGRARTGLIGLASVALVAAMTGPATTASATEVRAATSHGAISVALSNSYDGNTWRQEMVANFTQAAKELQAQGKISKFTIVNGDNDASQQNAQLDSLILEGYKAIIIDAASTTALNGTVAKACDAGIAVVAFDGLVTAPCAYDVALNYELYGEDEVAFVAQQLHGHGNLLEIRGVAGTSIDKEISAGIHKEVAKYPGLKIVGSVHGNWTESVAQTAVEGILPSLPTINAVVDQGGDGSGAVAAFQALHKPVPLVIMGNRGVELRTWQQLLKKDPSYKTMSMSSMPGMSSIALDTAYLIATGHKVPKTLYIPVLEITQKTLNAWAKATPVTGVGTLTFSLAQTQSMINANLAGHPQYVYSGLPQG